MVMRGNGEGPRWSVGTLAKVTGLTVRTLHHYDELGLLRPSERTPSGHRRYTEGDLRRLYQIRLLRRLGLSLEEVGEALAEAADASRLREVLVGRLEELDDQAWRLAVLREQTRNLLDQLDGPRRPDSAGLLALMGCTGIFDEHLTREQRAVLDERAEDLDADAKRWLDAEWPLVLSKLVGHYRSQDPVDDPGVRETARRLSTVTRMFAGDDPDIVASMARFFREHGYGVLRDVMSGEPLSDLGDGLWDYVGRVYAASDAG